MVSQELIDILRCPNCVQESEGELEFYKESWFICQAHPDHHLAKNKGTGVSIDDCFTMIDMQAGHCTTGQFKGQVDPELNPQRLFTVQNMRTTGR